MASYTSSSGLPSSYGYSVPDLSAVSYGDYDPTQGLDAALAAENASNGMTAAPYPPLSSVAAAPTLAAAAPAAGAASGGLGVSPAYLAFTRALGLSDATDAATTQSSIDALNRRAGLSRGDILASGEDARQGINNSMEARGLRVSGENLLNQAKQRAAEGSQLANLDLSTAENTDRLVAQLAQNKAARADRGAEQGLNVAEANTAAGYQ